MAWGYVNTQLNCIEADIENLNGQIEDIFQNLNEKGLGDIFRDAVMGGSVCESSFDGLSADVSADLKEVFNGACFAEMAPGVFMAGGPDIRVSSDYPQGRALRVLMIRKIFDRAAKRGNRTAGAVKADLARLAFLAAKIDLLKKEKAFLIASAAPDLKIA